MKLRPSSLPAIRQCGSFEPSPGGEAAERGTVRHKALAALYSEDRPKLDGLTLDEREAIEWAADYIRANASSEEPVRFEHKLAITDEDFGEEIMRGTPDAVAGPDLFDLKWHRANYREQMAAYVLMRCQETGRAVITVHLLFGDEQRAVKFALSAGAARQIVDECIANAGKPPTPCDYCGWCAKRLTCPALLNRVEAVRSGREDWQLENYHASQINDANEMSKALTLARTLKDWCEAVEFHAKELATRLAEIGETLPGFKLRPDEGRRFILDVVAAYNSAGLPQEKFLQCCDIRFSTSKTAPDKKGIEDVYAEFHGMKKAPAKRALAEKLSAVIQHGKPSVKLVKTTESQKEE